MTGTRPKPISAPLHGDDGREYLRDVLEPALEKGEIPNLIRESERLIAEGDGPDGDKVIAYIRHVMDKLSVASTGQPCPPYDIYLSDMEGAKAGVITKGPKPVLIVGLGLLEELQAKGMGEDHLAAILGHERFHVRRHQTWQQLLNSRPEETVADIYGIMEAEKAGYNPQAMGAFFRALWDEEKGSQMGFATLGAMLDEHPMLDDRIRNSDVAMAALQLRKRLTETMTPLPPEIMEAASRTCFSNFFETHAAQTRYDTQTPAKQLAILVGFYDRVLPQWDSHMLMLHLAQSRPAMKALRATGTVMQPALTALMSYMARPHDKRSRRWHRYPGHNHYMHDKAYKYVLNRLTELATPPPEIEEDEKRSWLFERDENKLEVESGVFAHQVLPPVFKRINADSKAFWASTTRQEAVEAARRFNNASRILARYKRGMIAFEYQIERASWPHRRTVLNDITAQGFALLPWSAHLQWAQGDDADSILIKKTAMNLGCNDPRLTREDVPWMNRDSHGYIYSEITFDAEGRIIGLARTQKEIDAELLERFHADNVAALMEREYTRQEARVTAEKEAQVKTDWSALEADFWGFIAEHKAYLVPERSIVPTEYPFAEAFTEKLLALCEANPQKWGTYAHEFFNDVYGETFKGENTESRDEYHSNEYFPRNPYTMRALASISDRSYGIHRKYDALKHSHRGKLPEGHPLEPLLAAYPDMREASNDYIYNDETEIYDKVKRPPQVVPPEDEYIHASLTTGMHHPYINGMAQFKETTKKNIQRQLKTRYSLLHRFDYKNPQAETLDSFYHIEPYGFLGLPRPRSIDALAQTKVRLSAFDNEQYQTMADEITEMTLLPLLEKNLAAKAPKRQAVASLDFMNITSGFTFFENASVAEAISQRLKNAVDAQVRVNMTLDLASNVGLETLLDRFCKDHSIDEYSYKEVFKDEHAARRYRYDEPRGHNIFETRPEIKVAYLGGIRTRIDALDASERYVHLTRLMQMPLDDPEYRKWAIDSWVESAAAILGPDDASPAYTDPLMHMVDDALRIMQGTQAMASVTRLLDAVEAQREASFAVREKLKDSFGKNFLLKDGLMRVVESGIKACAGHPKMREAFLTYVTEPLTEAGTTHFVKMLKRYASESELMRNIKDENKRIVMSPMQENMVMDGLHRNFWALPFELRTVHLDRVLFPTNAENADQFDIAIQYVLDKVLPVDRPFAPEAREALMVYLDCCPPELRRVTFSALLATVDHGQGEVLRPGQVLSQVLTRTGAAGGQILQAGHSYLSGVAIDSPDLALFRDDLKSSKVDFAPPYRWEIFERLDETVTDAERAAIDRIGKVLGCGSTAYVVEAHSAGARSAIKMMRKEVAPIADLQFERYHDAFKKLATMHSMYRPLPGMVDHAREHIKVSTNGHIAALQVEYAGKIYDDLRIEVDGRTIGFAVAPVVSSGLEYIRTGLVEGVHINDMEAASHGDKPLLCMGIEAAEIHHMLQGRAIDEDRHGGQQKIVEGQNAVGMFDVGGIPYSTANAVIDAPTSTQKRALGRLLGFIFNAAARGQSPVTALVDAVTGYEWGIAKPYLVGIKRAMLARMDIQRGFSDDVETRGIIHAKIFKDVFMNTTVDKQILEGMADTITLDSLHEIRAPKAVTGPTIIVHDRLAPKRAHSLATQIGIVARAGLRRSFTAVGMAGPIVKPLPDPANNSLISRRAMLALRWNG